MTQTGLRARTFFDAMNTRDFNDLELHRIFTETYEFRHEHIKILEDFGFKYEGTMREHLFVNNSPCDSHLHGLLAHESSS